MVRNLHFIALLQRLLALKMNLLYDLNTNFALWLGKELFTLWLETYILSRSCKGCGC